MADDKILKALEEREERKARELWFSNKPSATQCKKCIFAFPDTEYTVGAEKANCEMYMSPDDKPPGILWENESCPFFEEKEEA